MTTSINNPENIQERYTDYYGLDSDVTPEIPMKGLLGWTGTGWEKITSTGGALNITGPYWSLASADTGITGDKSGSFTIDTTGNVEAGIVKTNNYQNAAGDESFVWNNTEDWWEFSNDVYVTGSLTESIPSLYKLDQTTPQDVVPKAGTAFSLTTYDVLPTMAPGAFEVPAIAFTNSNLIGFSPYVGAIRGGVLSYAYDGEAATMGVINDLEASQYGILEYDSVNEYPIFSIDGYCSVIYQRVSGDGGATWYPVMGGRATDDSPAFVVESPFIIWDGTGTGAATCFAVSQDFSTNSVIFQWIASTETFYYIGDGGMVLCANGTAGATATPMTLQHHTLGDGSNNDGIRLKFEHRNDTGLLGSPYTAGYIDCIQTDKTGSSEDSYLAFGGYTNGAVDQFLKLSGTGATIGSGTAGVDYTLTFDGETNDGTITFMEDENWFAFGNNIFLGTKKITTAAAWGMEIDGNAKSITGATSIYSDAFTTYKSVKASTYSQGYNLANAKAATAIAPECYSPFLWFNCYVWDESTSAAKAIRTRQTFIPTTGATPYGRMSWDWQYADAGAYAEYFAVYTNGNIDIYGNAYLLDSKAVYFGTGDDASISYDGTDLTINPKAVGSGKLKILGDVEISGTNLKVGSTTLTEQNIIDLLALL